MARRRKRPSEVLVNLPAALGETDLQLIKDAVETDIRLNESYINKSRAQELRILRLQWIDVLLEDALLAL